MGPLALADVGIEMVGPTLTALLPDSAWKVERDIAPADFAHAVPVDKAQQDAIFLCGPGTFNQPRLKYFVPAVQALHVGATVAQCLRDHLPIFAAKLGHSLAQAVIFITHPFDWR